MKPDNNAVHVGSVIFFDGVKGFGFIEFTDSRLNDLYFHLSSLSENYIPVAGDKVSFEIGNNKKGKIAVNVCKSK